MPESGSTTHPITDQGVTHTDSGTGRSAVGAAESLREVNRQLRDYGIARSPHRRIGPFTRFVLFSGGAKVDLLRVVPVEIHEFRIQGSGVILTACMALLTGYLGMTLLVTPVPPIIVRIIGAIIFSSLVYTVDRLLVSGTLRPHVFDEDVLTTLWDPYADMKWYTLIAGAGRNKIASRLSAFVTVTAKVSVRFLLAFLISYIMADTLAIYIFAPTVNATAHQMIASEHTAAVAAINNRYQAQTKSILNSEQVAEKTQQNSTQLTITKTAYATDQATVKKLSNDLSLLTGIIDAERDGYKVPQVTLSDGTKYPPESTTSGIPGCKQRCEEAESKYDSVNSELKTATASMAKDHQALQSQLAALPSTTEIDKSYNEQLAEAAQQKAAAMKQVPSTHTHLDLLIRRAALSDLESSPKPWNETLGEKATCAKGAGWICSVRNVFFPNTPMGSYVAALRWTLLLIDLVPILLKIYYSLRDRRPYDALVGALEELAIADVVNGLDDQLNDLGEQLEERAVLRREQRRDAGAAGARREATIGAKSLDMRLRWKKDRQVSHRSHESTEKSRNLFIKAYNKITHGLIGEVPEIVDPYRDRQTETENNGLN